MQLTKRFLNHKGVDLKSSDLLRPSDFASNMRNAQYSEGGSIKKRVGYQGHSRSVGGCGTFTYRRVDVATGAQEPEVLTVDDNIHKLETAQISIAYIGADPTCVLTFFLDATTRTYKLQIIEGTATVVNYDVGVGFDEASPITLANVKTVIDAVANFSATITGDTTTPAAFMIIEREADLASSAWAGVAKYWTQVFSPTTNPLSAYYATRYSSDFENVSSIQINNLIYFGSGLSETLKYDGQSVYRAGMPAPASLGVALSAGAVTGSNYIHKIQYEHIDNSGNFVEGNLFSSTAVNAAAQKFDLTIPNILAASGFNTNCAIVAGAQVAVNVITVDNGSGGAHTMQVGDTAYFYDAVSASYVTREVTARNATTITVAGAAVTVADNAVISNNLRILIWRSKTSGASPTTFYLVDEIPNNSFTASQAYTDNKLDTALGEILLAPATDRTPPPKAKYISQWNGQMVIAGVITDPTLLAWSDIDSPEYFPNNTNQIYIEPGNGDVLVAIAPNNEVFTAHGNVSFTVISGDLSTGQIRVETRARDIGCAAHASIVDIDGVLAWLGPKGPVQSSGGQVPLPLGAAIDPSESNQASRLDPIFSNDGKPEAEKLRLKRTVGFNDTSSDTLIFFVPAEDGDDALRYANSSSLMFAYDRVRDAWLIWDNVNAAGGMTSIDSEIYFVERRYSTFTSNVESIMYRRHNMQDAYDYADNTVSIDFDYSPQWEFMGEPSVLKDPIAIKVFSLESVPNNQFTLTVEQEINFQTDASSATFDMLVSGGGYGFSSYGVDAYSDPTVDGYIHPLGRQRQRSIRPRFKNEVIHEAVLITGWELEISVPYRPEFKP